MRKTQSWMAWKRGILFASWRCTLTAACLRVPFFNHLIWTSTLCGCDIFYNLSARQCKKMRDYIESMVLCFLSFFMKKQWERAHW
jgi:hypothetical protein